MLRWNPFGDFPQIDGTAYIDPTAIIIGKVKIGKNVYIGPGVIIRADEPDSSIVIGDNCNVQDKAVIHALERTSVEAGERTSLAHGCIVHGPCKIGKGCFIGFGSVVFNTEVGENVFIKHLAVVEGVDIPSGKLISNGAVVDIENKVNALGPLPKELEVFSEKVIITNLDLVRGYKNV